MILSDSLSLSSYSSWLLPPRLRSRGAVYRWSMVARRCRRRRRVLESCWTRSPSVMISSAIDDSEEEDGWEETSIHDSMRKQ